MSGIGLLNPFILKGVSLQTIIENASLTTNLKVVLDAGDNNSYTSGQSWLDTSGAGIDFFRGTDGTSQSSDPTFTGTVGRLSINEYWAFDGADQFQYDSANETWMQNLHKNSALFTVLFFYYLGAAANRGLFGTRTSSSNIGVSLEVNNTPKLTLRVGKGGSPNALEVSTDAGPGANAWHMSAISIDEATGSGGGFFYLDGGYSQVSSSNTFDATYTTPSSSAATYVMQLGARGNENNRFESGDRMACFAAWEGRALTKANLDLIWDKLRHRFSI